MISLLEVVRRSTGFLEKAGLESPRLDAEWLIAHALGLKRMQLYLQFERPLTEQELAAIRPLVRRRGKREPLQHILGESEFLGLALKVDPRALIPRPETEELADWLARQTPPPATVLDLGTGTGALALAMAKSFPEAAVTATDRSPTALDLARENAERTGLASRIRFVDSDWYGALGAGERFDWIVSNPPYLTGEEWAEARPEVNRFEPREALVAEERGLADLLTILEGASHRLRSGGLLALETGLDQHAALRERAGRLGFADCRSLPDMSGRDRFFTARWQG